MNPLKLLTQPGFDYVVPANPTISVNPAKPYVTWLNSSTGELFVCTDATTGANKWAGQAGTRIGFDVYADNVSLLLPFSENTLWVDKSSNVLPVSLTGATITAAANKFYNSSIYFDGNDHLYVPHSTEISFGTGDFTIEFWINPDASQNNSYPAVLAKDSDPAAGSDFLVYISASSGVLNVKTSSNQIGGAVTSGVWSHFAASRVSGVLYVFINGSLASSNADTTNLASTQHLYFGRQGDDTTHYFKGFLQDFRMTKGAGRYSANFTPPTQLWAM